MAGTGLAIAGIAGPMVQSGGNMLFQAQQNKLNRQFAEGQALLQRQWANEDWEKTNAYNTPAAQKQRFKEAGLNPNMMYAGGGGSTPSATVRSTPPAQYHGIAPQSNINFQSLMQIPVMMEQTRQLQLINEAKALDNRMLKESAGLLPPTNNEYFRENGETMQDATPTYLKNNPYSQTGDIRVEKLRHEKFVNDMNAATEEEQKNKIVSNAAIVQINEAMLRETNPVKIDLLKKALENATNQEKLSAAQVKLADMEIGLQDQYFIGTLIKILSMMK